MATNSLLLRRALLCIALIVGLASLAQAQAYNPQQNVNYFLDPNSEVPRFIQRLSWEGGEYTLHYEVLIERREGRSYRRVLQEIKKETFIEVSLAPGNYRFCVTPYDLLERPGESTDWVNIEVRHALNPNLIDSSQTLLKEDKKTYLYLDVYADDIHKDAEIFLRAPNGRIIVPEEVEFFDDGGFRLCYDSKIFKSGEYEVYVRNPGGLEGSLGIVYIEPESQFKIFLGAAYMPVFKIYAEAPEWNMANAGAAFRFAAVYFFSEFYLGPELVTTYLLRPITGTAQFFGGGQTVGAELSLLLGRMMLYQKMGINIRFGAGYNILMGLEELQGYITVNTGASFLWRAMKHFYMELGVDYIHQLDENNSGFMRPFFGLGVQF